MMRLSVVLAGLLMVSALSLVTLRFQARELFMQVEQLKVGAHDLENDWRRLQLKRAELARNARIDALARNELHLVPVDPERTLYLQQGQGRSEGQP
ncbi:cell division protein FtsL [Castellaniella sp.]|uniref:cell division protein FtsL n=1 Tax=Castellaniella sp. TaxID=1955812 RepID=UPI0035602673